jgi:hypothetical protein
VFDGFSVWMVELHYQPMYGHDPMSPSQLVPQLAPGFYTAEELEQRSSILKQIEYYFRYMILRQVWH